jgi:hypothetical protein
LIRRLLLVAFFIEVGLLLIVLPWSDFWETNYFGSLWPALLPVMTNDFVRGGVSGIGFINLGSGIAELVAIFVLRTSQPERPTTVEPTGILPNGSDSGIEP